MAQDWDHERTREKSVLGDHASFNIPNWLINKRLTAVHLFEAFYAIYVNSYSLSISNFLATGSAA
jgi:hypothetical protein